LSVVPEFFSTLLIRQEAIYGPNYHALINVGVYT